MFDVLRNSLSGELGVVVGVMGDHLDLKLETGAISRFKYGPHFWSASGDEAIAFRAKIRAVRLEQRGGKKTRAAIAFLRKLAKKGMPVSRSPRR